MGADREGGVRRRPGRAVAYSVCGAVLLAGCASMPDSGDLRDVESTPRQDTGVRVFAMPPAEDAEPGEIMQGFLEALTSDDPQYDTARKYLTADAARTWRPERSATVLLNGPSAVPGQQHPGGRDATDSGSLTYVLTGSMVATVGAQQAYKPAAGSYSEKVHLTKDAKSGQWRIDALPQGVVMGKSDFQRNYTSVNKYYFASATTVGATGQPVAVADPVFVRSKVDPMTQMVRSLLSGPTRWLGPVVRSSFPTGTALQEGVSGLAPDDQNRLTVPLNSKVSHAGAAKCTEMATQLLFTLRNLTPTLESVELQGPGRHRLCDLTEERAESVAWHASASAQSPEYLYFLDGKHRLVRLPTGSAGTSAVPVPGPLGEGEKELQSVAVSRDEHTVAGIGADGKALYVTSLASGGSLGEAVVSSQGATATDRLTTPSWDARGDLWVADRDPRHPKLYVLEQGVGKPVEVTIPDGRIRDVRVAADGVRVALVVEKDDKQQSLLIGRIERDDKSGARPAVRELRSAAPDLEQVTTMSWAGDSRLVVVGLEQGGVHQMRYVQVDGSALDGPAPAALSGVKAIAASEDERVPMVAYSEDGIVRLPSGAQWQKVDKDGTAPVYPG
ncbi:LpqB family beta-propeller domain-containing protein [Streptomyces sp. NPDC001410]|uniref:LpqB family beta-propeller domain-containing protein n=1 Tax=Streptomyces sp. NPDC001410 TaxID=3364574 RepID=UPI0036823007